LLVSFVLPGLASARELPKSLLPSYEPWDEEVVHTFENLLVQEGGRVKPLYSVARFTLLQFSGKTTASFQTVDGVDHKLHYAEWLLNVLFKGDVAKDMPVFIVDDSAAVVQIGVSPKSKRDRYSYNELFAGRAKLAELSAQFAEKQKKYEDSEKDPQYELGRVEGMILTLGRNISSFEYLIGQFGFARQGELLVNENILPTELTDLAKRLDVVEMLERMPEMTLDQLVQAVRSQPGNSEDERMFSGALRLFFFHANTARGLNLFPPREMDNEVWLSASDVMIEALGNKEVRPWAGEQLDKIKVLVEARNEGPEVFATELTNFSEWQHSISDPRGEGLHSDLEVQMYRDKPFSNALYCFVLAFVVMAFSWLTPGSKTGKVLILVASLIAVVGLVLNIYGITLRSVIRQRPPITNLYDTVIFITATAVLLGLLIEWFTRLGVGTLVAILSGVMGMFLSMKYEAKEATDTITQLVAVLDTNFWLATHVTIINIGYAAGLVAAIIGIIYLTGRFVMMLLGRKAKDFFKTLTRMNYGVICFCLFFALVGTVLGGIWANYSWGRFWGWDPKENGALMICLWTLVILHGRMAGWIRDLGVHMNAIILAIITTFSWWGVNNLGVGLHSYGFTEGVWGALYSSWGVLGVFLLMGVIIWFNERKKKSLEKSSAKSGEPVPA
ncbi:MAG: cytochrome c biogenesis protein CcsA, partial [Verrucomicrobiales bacterium]|nr:cytochrome c biogenesis protein CcsA [Verrucomicrobiales bacterium]